MQFDRSEKTLQLREIPMPPSRQVASQRDTYFTTKNTPKKTKETKEPNQKKKKKKKKKFE